MIEEIRKLKTGDTVNIQDAPIVQHLSGEMSDSLLLSIGEISLITSEFWTLRIADLNQGQESLAKIMIFEAGEAVDIHIVTGADWVPTGTRSDLIETGRFFLFGEPEDTENFKVEDLNISTEFSLTCDGEEITMVSPTGTLYGESSDGNLASFTPLTGPHFSSYILDIGEGDSWIEYYEGQTINPDLIDFFIK